MIWRCFLSLLITGAAVASGADALVLEKGDRISIIGNTLADRMQHDGWLETFIQSRFPEHDLVFRNLGFSGDELTLRLRSRDFGSPDDHLAKNQTDVVFAFFGYNESFAGAASLDKFRGDLADFVKHTAAQQYNGERAPRLVLFSPIAHEDLQSPNLPDGAENNARLELYSNAMAEVAAEHGVAFVDLFHPTRQLYADTEQPLTTDGVHLNTDGNRALAEVIDSALFSGAADRTEEQLANIREAVLEKNFFWFNRYRTVDGYSIYGGRADLRFVQGQTNRVVMQREMEVLDVMTANRDRLIWAVARGDDLIVDDSNAPPFIPVVTNKPGEGPGGEHLFLSGEESLKQMTVAPGMKVELVASEEQFPELINPVQMAWDTEDRLWVAAWASYPHWKPGEKMDDKLLILEDIDGDGRADVCKTFADGLHNPTGFEFYGGGVIVAMAPDLLFLKDTDGDDRADVRERILHGLDTADTHHTANSFVLSPGGALFFQEGTFHHTQVETPYGPTVRSANAAVYRYEPRTQKFEVYVAYGFANPHGHVFDRWGQDFVHDGTGAVPFHAALFSGHTDFPRKHPRPPTLYEQRTRPCPATEILSSRHFPEENQGNLLVGNVIGFQGILHYRFEDKGASFVGIEEEPIVSSTDPSFRPVDIEMGPDGAIYFTDWLNPIIGHMQHNLRDPSRDRLHGRVYRVIYPSRPLLKPIRIAGEPLPHLLDLLKEPEDRVRYRARIELSDRDSDEVIAALKDWIAGLDERSDDYEHLLLEALWVHQQHNVPNDELLSRVLASADFRARAAAARVMCYMRDQVPDSLALFKRLAADPHPRVRLEAVRSASFYEDPEAVEVPLISAEYPTDQYLDFTRDETMKTLEPYWKQAIADGREIAFSSDAGARFFLKNVTTDELLRLPRSRGVYRELLYRDGVREEYRQEAISGLARAENQSELRVLLDAIGNLEAGQQGDSAVYDLVRLLTSRRPAELATVRDDLVEMATSAALPVVRQIGYVALITADGNVDRAWELGVRSTGALRDLVNAMPMVPDPSVRAKLYPKVEPLLYGLPAELASPDSGTSPVRGRRVRIELPGRGVLTLAEVEVYSDGVNVARQGKARQKNTSNGGVAERAVDGNRSGSYSDGGQTHTEENSGRPWWEVDLGRELPIDTITVYNRTDGKLGDRLHGFTLRVLDGDGNEVYAQQDIPAPDVKAEFEVGGGGPAAVIRRAAMLALTHVRGRELPTFQALANFIREDVDRATAIRAVQRIPRTQWPRDEAPALLDSLMQQVRQVPAQLRTTPAALDAFELAHSLTALLPSDEAARIRAELDDLGVRVIRIGTLPHRMAYDREQIVVKAGKPVEFIFENTDIMPHNLVIVPPGAMEEIGLLGESTATDPDAMARGFVPESDKLLMSSRLLQPGESQKLSFTPPGRPGIYPYVCTYPGHWRRMYGALYVVEDMEAYQAAPEEYLASAGLEIADELLKYNRPRTEWKLEDLQPLVAELTHGRSFGAGKQMFEVANCTACHKLNGVGFEFAPDLSKLAPEFKQLEILKELIDPSARINEKYYNYIFELESGRVVTGLVVEETPDEVKVIENPLAKNEPVTLKKSEIAEHVKSNVSMMPQGLLDKLTREEILDLIAYITARGDEHHMLFEGGHDHHHGSGH